LISPEVGFVDRNDSSIKLSLFHTGASNVIVFVISPVVFHNASRVVIYTVLVQFHIDSVHGLVSAHVVRFVGLAVFQYAIWIPLTHVSVGHVIFNVTNVVSVHVALSLIVNANHVGAAVSYKYVHVFEIQVLPAVSEILNIILKSVE
jgi:hypothetical protein